MLVIFNPAVYCMCLSPFMLANLNVTVGEHEHSNTSNVTRVQLEQCYSRFDPVLLLLGLSTNSGLLQITQVV